VTSTPRRIWKGVRPLAASAFFATIINQITFAADMKKLFILSMLISFAMICSCQKQDSAAEQQPAQRKTEVDTRETALIERLNALDEKVNALDEKVKALGEKAQTTLNAGTTATGVQGQTPDPAQVTAERDRAIEQFRALHPNPSRVRAGDPAKQKRPAAQQLGPEDLQRQWQQNLDKTKMSGKAVSPAVEATSPIPSPTPE
jgi:outer membrane translocation and assembly module TamA